MTQTTINQIRWTSRYEIIDGELFVTRAPHIGHQDCGGRVYVQLFIWLEATKLGKPFLAPGVIFTDADDVIPDIVWVKQDRLAKIVDEAGHLTAAPDLVVEVLSAWSHNERRDRDVKLRLHSLKGVVEYWIVNWRLQPA